MRKVLGLTGSRAVLASILAVVAMAAGATQAQAVRLVVFPDSLGESPPTVTTGAASSLTQTSATLNAVVNPNGAQVSDCHFDYGTSLSYGSSVPCSVLPGAGTSAVAVSAALAGLSAETTYYFRIVATNAEGTEYGVDQALTTLPEPPTVASDPASAETQASATLHALVNPEGTPVRDCHFEYGTTTSYGSSAPCTPSPGSEESPVAVSATVAGLIANTTYHFRIVARNTGGVSNGSDETFKTLPNAPIVVTEAASAVAENTATLNAAVNPNGSEVSRCEFEYGTSEAYGQIAPCSALPGSGSSPVAVSAAITGLTLNTTYHYRIVATNPGGTSKGSDETFRTLPNAPTVVTEAASAVADSTATLNGTVNPNGSEVSRCEFEYGTSEAYGQIAPCSALPGSGSSPVAVSAAITGLTLNTTYHYRIVATNPGGTSRGSDQSFTTLGGLCGPTNSPGGQGIGDECNWYNTKKIVPAGTREVIFMSGGFTNASLTQTSALGEVSCKTVGFGIVENPAGGAAGVGSINGFGFYSCIAPKCEKEAEEQFGKPGHAAITALNLPWNQSLSEGGTPRSVRDHIGVPFSGTFGSPSRGEMDIRLVCEVAATGKQVTTANFEGQLEPEIGIGTGASPGLNGSFPSELSFTGASSGALHSELGGEGTFSGLLKYVGYASHTDLEVW
jgi:phosphodiesterase/alkaline phosphatase D-like protein